MAKQGEELSFYSVGDGKGVLYWLGTAGRLRSWVNPADNSRGGDAPVEVLASSCEQGALTHVTDWIFKNQNYRSANVANSWVAIDLRQYEVNVKVYSMAHASGVNSRYLRSWTLQGSRDNHTWEDIDVRDNDTALTRESNWMAFAVPETDSYYRYVRILMKPSGNADGTHHLTLNCFELYGFLRPLKAKPAQNVQQVAQQVQAQRKSTPNPLNQPHKPPPRDNLPAPGEKSYRWGSGKGDVPAPKGSKGSKGDKGGDFTSFKGSRNEGSKGFDKGSRNEVGKGFDKGSRNEVGKGFDKGGYKGAEKGDKGGYKGGKASKGTDSYGTGTKGAYSKGAGKSIPSQSHEWDQFRDGLAKGSKGSKGLPPGFQGRGSISAAGSGRGRGGGTPHEPKEPVPQEPLKCLLPTGTTKFPFSAVNDHKGIIFYLGCDSGKSTWSNPHTGGKVKVTASSFFKGKPHMAVDHTFVDQVLFTANESDSWIQIDLKSVKVTPTHYVFSQRAGLKDYFPRKWTFEGSNDGKDFVVIKSYNNDFSFDATKEATCSFAVSSKQAYSIFRVKLADKGNSKNTSALVLSCFDIYGTIKN